MRPLKQTALTALSEDMIQVFLEASVTCVPLESGAIRWVHHQMPHAFVVQKVPFNRWKAEIRATCVLRESLALSLVLRPTLVDLAHRVRTQLPAAALALSAQEARTLHRQGRLAHLVSTVTRASTPALVPPSVSSVQAERSRQLLQRSALLVHQESILLMAPHVSIARQGTTLSLMVLTLAFNARAALTLLPVRLHARRVIMATFPTLGPLNA